MPEETRHLLSAAERLAALIDTLSEAFAAELADVLRGTERRLTRLVVAAMEGPRAGRRTRLAEAARVAALRDQMREALRAAGYDDLAETAVRAGLDRVIATVRRTTVGGQVSRFVTSAIAQRLDTLRVLATTDLLHQGDVIAQALYRAVRDGVLSEAPTPVLLERLAETLDLEVREVRTLYDTATATYTRIWEAEASTGEAGEVFFYAGPVDAKMRPFCADHVGQVFTRAAIDKLDNGQRLDVFLTGGGWNCRHIWMPLSDVSELAPLANTGARAPEVVEALRDVRPVKRARAA
jgi:hypothetical protein